MFKSIIKIILLQFLQILSNYIFTKNFYKYKIHSYIYNNILYNEPKKKNRIT